MNISLWGDRVNIETQKNGQTVVWPNRYKLANPITSIVPFKSKTAQS